MCESHSYDHNSHRRQVLIVDEQLSFRETCERGIERRKQTISCHVNRMEKHRLPELAWEFPGPVQLRPVSSEQCGADLFQVNPVTQVELF